MNNENPIHLKASYHVCIMDAMINKFLQNLLNAQLPPTLGADYLSTHRIISAFIHVGLEMQQPLKNHYSHP